MKASFIFLLVFSLAPLNAQEEEIPVDNENPEMEVIEGEDVKDNAQDNNIRVECVCPQNETSRVEEEELTEEMVEESQPMVFPPGTVVNINPDPSKETQEANEVEEEEDMNKLPPGYIEKLPPGYSNDTYVPIAPLQN